MGQVVINVNINIIVICDFSLVTVILAKQGAPGAKTLSSPLSVQFPKQSVLNDKFNAALRLPEWGN